MWSDLLLGFGLVAVIEGLVLALAPRRLHDILKALDEMSPETLRLGGLAFVALGVALVAASKALG
ncbi:MAG: DUF2065 domain-containing protein [Pseudomonadota bacterium]